MSAYKRFISYIFSYENGVKKDNVGYARIENYNEECRISIYMKDAIKREQKASVYLFYRENEKIQGIFMKEMSIKNGVGDCKITTESKNIGGSNCNFENIGGIIIYITANRFWGTEWDDKPIYGFEPVKLWEKPEEMLERDEKKKVLEETAGREEKTENGEKPANQEEAENEEQIKKDGEIEKGEKKEPEEQLLHAAVLGEEAEEQEEKRYFEENTDFKRDRNFGRDIDFERNRELERDTDYERNRASERNPDCEESHHDCFDPYTKVYPFYDQERECIGISPEDLAKISPVLDKWRDNDFVRYGYGRFRHILLLRRRGEEEKEEYFIGVPGMYRPDEERLAVAYGFTMFVPTKKQKAEHGDFGYWCTMVKM